MRGTTRSRWSRRYSVVVITHLGCFYLSKCRLKVQPPAQNRRILNHYTPKDLHSQDYLGAQNYTGRRAMCIEFAICISDTTLSCSNSTAHVDHLAFTIYQTCLARHRAYIVHLDLQRCE